MNSAFLVLSSSKQNLRRLIVLHILDLGLTHLRSRLGVGNTEFFTFYCFIKQVADHNPISCQTNRIASAHRRDGSWAAHRVRDGSADPSIASLVGRKQSEESTHAHTHTRIIPSSHHKRAQTFSAPSGHPGHDTTSIDIHAGRLPCRN